MLFLLPFKIQIMQTHYGQQVGLSRKRIKCSHHSNNGWMKSIHNSEGKEANHIEYQPIIDRDPNDHNTIYTALLQCIEKEKPNISMIAFDLPLCLNSVDIILSRNHPIIPRLGGFHLLKFFWEHSVRCLLIVDFVIFFNLSTLVRLLLTASLAGTVMAKLSEPIF